MACPSRDQITKRRYFSERQIIGMSMRPTFRSPICRKHGVSDASSYKRKATFGGMEVSEAKRLKTLEDENTRLKLLLADA